MADEELLTVDEVAKRLKVHRESVRRWIREGKLSGSLLGAAGYRIPESEVERFLKETRRAG